MKKLLITLAAVAIAASLSANAYAQNSSSASQTINGSLNSQTAVTLLGGNTNQNIGIDPGTGNLNGGSNVTSLFNVASNTSVIIEVTASTQTTSGAVNSITGTIGNPTGVVVLAKPTATATDVNNALGNNPGLAKNAIGYTISAADSAIGPYSIQNISGAIGLVNNVAGVATTSTNVTSTISPSPAFTFVPANETQGTYSATITCSAIDP